MPKAYFEPENLDALVEVFDEAKRILQQQGATEPSQLDEIARRILKLACDGVPPWKILGEILPPTTPPALDFVGQNVG